MTNMKTQFKDYVPRVNGKRSIEEAIAEIQREMDVRKRIFDKWVLESKMSWMDAHDRMERLMSALTFLIRHAKALETAENEQNNTSSPPISFIDIHAAADAETAEAIALDTAPAQATA